MVGVGLNIAVAASPTRSMCMTFIAVVGGLLYKFGSCRVSGVVLLSDFWFARPVKFFLHKMVNWLSVMLNIMGLNLLFNYSLKISSRIALKKSFAPHLDKSHPNPSISSPYSVKYFSANSSDMNIYSPVSK